MFVFLSHLTKQYFLKLFLKKKIVLCLIYQWIQIETIEKNCNMYTYNGPGTRRLWTSNENRFISQTSTSYRSIRVLVSVQPLLSCLLLKLLIEIWPRCATNTCVLLMERGNTTIGLSNTMSNLHNFCLITRRLLCKHSKATIRNCLKYFAKTCN